MAVEMEQNQVFKHFCKVCKKGFVCGRALGGHMRAHGIAEDVTHVDNDEAVSDWEEKLGENSAAGSKRMYAFRTNRNGLRSCRSCKNCGKEFVSWKSFLNHGKCCSDDAESLFSSRGSEEDDGEDGREEPGGCRGWSKGKRTRRVVIVENLNLSPSPNLNPNPNLNSSLLLSEEEDLAHCLVMLSSSRVEPAEAVETEESCASASKDEERKHWIDASMGATIEAEPDENKAKGGGRGVFECKACKKVFKSHQALGGHRASHKKVKGCFAAKLDEFEESMIDEDVITHDEFSVMPLRPPNRDPLLKKKPKVHECSICHRIFASGQALGGHKRCHWVMSNSPGTTAAKLQQLHQPSQPVLLPRPMMDKSEPPLDLNLPAPADNSVDPLSLEFPALYLQQWIGIRSNINNKNSNSNKRNSSSTSMLSVEDEAESRTKLAKLSELKDINLTGASTAWLQVGIGTAANESSK